MTKKIFSGMIALIMLFLLAGCNKDFELMEKAEYHFRPECYEEQYNTYTMEFDLDKNEQKVEINSECVSGTILLSSDNDIEGLPITVTPDASLTKVIEIPKNFGDYICFTAVIDRETEGDIIISMYAR